MTLQRLTAIRNRLNELGNPSHYYTEHARDTLPGNASAWNRKRIRIRLQRRLADDAAQGQARRGVRGAQADHWRRRRAADCRRTDVR